VLFPASASGIRYDAVTDDDGSGLPVLLGPLPLDTLSGQWRFSSTPRHLENRVLSGATIFPRRRGAFVAQVSHARSGDRRLEPSDRRCFVTISYAFHH
jgi:hypothetical protein